MASTLFLAVRPPAKAVMCPQSFPQNTLLIGGEVATWGLPPWPVCPDVLIEAQRRLFVGLTFQAAHQYVSTAKGVASQMDSRISYYTDIVSDRDKQRYPEESGLAHRLEIIWHPCDEREMEIAQLDDVVWYYAASMCDGTQPMIPIAIAVMDLARCLEQYQLVFPLQLVFPSLEVQVLS